MSKRNRREFLEDSMLAAASAVAAGGASRLWAQEATPSASPNERLGVVVVGVLGRGNSHIGEFAGRRDTEILYICDVDSEVGGKRVEEVAKRQEGRSPQFVQDLRRCLEDPRVDIVSIATPNHWHALAAIWAMQAGKDVYVEKPVSHNVSEGRRMVETARKHGRICQTGTQCRSSQGLIDAVAYLQSGKLGDVKLARGLCYKPRGPIGARGEYEVPKTVDYDLWLGPAPLAPLTRPRLHYDWHWQWAYGNGDLGNQGIHQMDICRWGLGLQELSRRVISYGGRFGYEDAGETANTQVVLHDFGAKSVVFEVRGLRTEAYKDAKVGVIFEGSEGYLVVASYESAAAFDRDGKLVQEFRGSGHHFGNFLQAVRSRKIDDLAADIEEGHQSSALCHTGNISYRLGKEIACAEASAYLESFPTTDQAQETLARTLAHLKDNEIELEKIQLRMGLPLEFDPQSETFVGQPDANLHLTREYRAPFVVPAAGQV